MKPFSKCYYLNACGLLLAGLIVTGISVGAGAWNAEKYGEALNLKDRYFEVTEPFTSMQLISDTANVVVKATDTDTCTVTATNMPENTIKVTVEDGKLCINAVPEHRKWYQYFQMGVNSPTSTITLSLPMNVYEQVELQNDIGNLTLQNVHADRISLKSDTGDMDLQSITGKSCSITNNIGSLSLQEVQIREQTDIQQDTGDLELTDCTFHGSSAISTQIGSMHLSDSEFSAATIESDTGDIRLKDCTFYQVCTIKSDVGDVKGSILADVNNTSIAADTDVGSVSIDGKKNGYQVPNALNTITIQVDTGDIRLTTQQPNAS